MSDAAVGHPYDRVDARLKVTGGARYAADYPLRRMAHAVLVQSTISRGRITEIDTQAAEKLPGVLAVLTYRNAPPIREVPPEGGRGGSSQSPGCHLMLQDDRIHFYGQHIAIVIADTLERAMEGAARVRVTYAPEPHQTDMDAHLDQAVPPQQKLKGKDPADTRRGDPDAGRAGAAASIDVEYRTPTENHNPLEPHGTVAVWEGPKLTLYDGTQYLYGVRKSVATALAMREEDIRVISRFIGGGFGSKGGTWPHVVLAAVAARHVGRPVKLVLRRQQMFTSVGRRSETRQRLRLAAAADGTLTSTIHDCTSQRCRYEEFVESAAVPTRILYACPNTATSHRLVELDTIAPTYQRAPGESVGVLALECAMDELAAELRMDPLELRLWNYAEQDPHEGLPWSSKSLRECYRQGAERFGWSSRKPEPRSMRDGQLLLGWGMATATYPMNRRPASARARVLQDGRVIVQSASHDLGTGAYTVLTQVAADALGVRFDQVECELGDTDYPEAGVSGGSSTTASVGSAIHVACRGVRDLLIQLATEDPKSPLHGLMPDRIGAADGRLFALEDVGRGETYATLLRRLRRPEVEAVFSSKPGDEQKQYSMHAFGAVFAEVSVDPDLGEIRVRRMVSAYASGKILNPKTARNQYMGGNVWGISMALMEHTVTDHRTGLIPNNSLENYLVPVNADIPPIDIILVPEEDPHVNPIGVKGVGEIGIVGSAAAVANAVYHATGRRVRDLPITLDKLL